LYIGKTMPKYTWISVALVFALEASAFQGPSRLVSFRRENIARLQMTRNEGKSIEEICRDEFCLKDEKTGALQTVSVAEKEQIFMDAMQAYYYGEKGFLSDEDFDKLKADLLWEGSAYSTLNRDELMFMTAARSYSQGSPIMSDQKFDALKTRLKEAGSKISSRRRPKAVVASGVGRVTFEKDGARTATLYAPPLIIATLLWLGVAYELVEFVRYLNPVVTLLAGSPLIYFGTKIGTEQFWLKDPLIAKGPCPSCGVETRVYFGNILSVEGFSETGQFNCPHCQAVLNVEKKTLRASTGQ